MNTTTPRRAPAALLLLALFLANAAIMVIELSAGKLIARYLGMSLHTWTAVIGIVLSGMAVGNFLGGRIADRAQPLRALAWLFLGAAAATGLILILNRIVGEFGALAAIPSWPLRILLHVGIVFFLPCVVLGAISPVLARALLGYGSAPGRTAGVVFGLGVFGALVGTFLTGYWLVFLFGVSTIIALSAGTLGALGITVFLLAMIFDDPRPESSAVIVRQERGPKAGLWVPALVVFVSNLAFMALELSAIRIMSREFGASIYTWTTAIGVVLAGISGGNLIGGWLADRFAPRNLLAFLFLIASITSAAGLMLAAYFSRALSEIVPLMIAPWPVQIALMAACLLLLPCLLVGAISPAAAAWRLQLGGSAGRAFGDVYAWGSAGSIVATFATGYFLIDLLGSRPLIAIAALTLALAAALLGRASAAFLVWTAMAVALVVISLLPFEGAMNASRGLGLRPAFREDTLLEDESQYSYVAVVQDAENPDIRNLVLDKLEHSRIDLKYPDDFKQEYEWIYQAVFEQFLPPEGPLNLLFIGGGGYVFPRHFALHRPGGLYEVAEIDPAVTHAAQVGMGLSDPPGFPIFHGDARNCVEEYSRRKALGETVPVFDAIVGDSFNDFSVPQHLVTLEFTEQLFELLSPSGLYVLNMIDMLEAGHFLGAVVHTAQQVFPFVYVLNSGSPMNVRDTFVVVCAKQAINLTDLPARVRARHPYAGGLMEQEDLAILAQRTNNTVLTDDYTPTDILLMPVVSSARLSPAEAYLDAAGSLSARGALDRAIASCRKAVELEPDWVEAREYLGDLLLAKGEGDAGLQELLLAAEGSMEGARINAKAATHYARLGRAEEAYPLMETALEEDAGLAHLAITLGTDAFEAQEDTQAQRWWELAVKFDPEAEMALYNLGLLRAAQKDYAGAIDWWEKAVVVNPGYIDALHNLALAYLHQKNFEGARRALDAIAAHGGTPDPQLLQALPPPQVPGPLRPQ